MLKEALSGILSPEETEKVYSAFDQVGGIVIIKIPDSLESRKSVIAQAILGKIKTAKSVFAQVSAVQGDYRVRTIEFIAGENTTLADYKEHGCRFKVDVARAYFSPRLSTERQRIAELVQDGETVVNMFAGIGTYSIVIAKMVKTCKVYSIDSNPVANDLCMQNAKLNKVSDRVVPICDDATNAIESRLAGAADRVIMPLPERAKEFVGPAVSALKQKGIVHYFAHVKADGKKEAKEAGASDAEEAFAPYEHKTDKITIVREVGPRIYQIVADVTVRK